MQNDWLAASQTVVILTYDRKPQVALGHSTGGHEKLVVREENVTNKEFTRGRARRAIQNRLSSLNSRNQEES